MPTITIDTLSEEAKAQLASIQFVDGEFARLQAKTATLQTARSAYVRALSELPPNDAAN